MIDASGKAVVPFAPGSRDAPKEDGKEIDTCGRAIVALLSEAADTARATCEHAMSTAQKLSQKLQAAEDQIKHLDADMRHYRDRATRAEKWLATIQNEIEQKFFAPKVAAVNSRS